MIRRYLHGERNAVWYDLTAIFISIVLCVSLGVFNTIYAHNQARRTEQKFCRVVGVQVEAYRQVPPQTDTGKKIADAMTRLSHDLKCEGTHVR